MCTRLFAPYCLFNSTRPYRRPFPPQIPYTIKNIWRKNPMPISSHPVQTPKQTTTPAIISVPTQWVLAHSHKKTFYSHALHFCENWTVSQVYQAIAHSTPSANRCKSVPIFSTHRSTEISYKTIKRIRIRKNRVNSRWSHRTLRRFQSSHPYQALPSN